MERQRLPIEEVFILKTSDQNLDKPFARWLVGYETAFALKVWYENPYYRAGIVMSEKDSKTNEWSEPIVIEEFLAVHSSGREDFVERYSEDGEFLTFSHTPLDKIKGNQFRLWIGPIELEWSMDKCKDVWEAALYVKDYRFPKSPRWAILRQFFNSEEAPDWDLCASM